MRALPERLLLSALLAGPLASVPSPLAAACGGSPPYPANPSVSYDYRECEVIEFTKPNSAPVPAARDLTLSPLTNICKNCNLQGPSCNISWSASAQASVSAEVEAGIVVAGVAVSTSVTYGVSATSGCDSGPISKCKTAFVNLGLTAHAEYTRQSVERFEYQACYYYVQRGGWALWEWLVTDDLVASVGGPAVSCGFEYDRSNAAVSVGGSCSFREGAYPCPDPKCPDCCPAEESPDKRSAAVPTPAGSRVVLTGEVVAGHEATLAVVGPQGQTLSGVVVEVGGEETTTGADGRATFLVATGVTTLVARIRDMEEGPGPAVETRVVSPPPGFDPASAPQITSRPKFPTAGSEFAVRGGPFDGSAAGNAAQAGERPLDVLAACPTELILGTPAEWPVGNVGPLTVTTAYGTSPPSPVTFVRLSLHADHTEILRGQRVGAQIRVEGTTERVSVRVINLSPSTVQLTGGDMVTVRTSGGTPNIARVRLTGVTPGPFSLRAEVTD